ncbi:MAG: class I SAM-dependent methyltransferase [Candidatus Pacearchaeota archaeon]|jgi:SAM-dependent methyltransferase
MKSDKSVIEVYSPIAKAWAHYPSPARPSKEEIDFYEKSILKVSQNKDIKVLILGVTPELRDICTKYKLDVTLVDISKDMAEAMENLVKNKNPKEKIVIANWLDMKFDTKFDLVMGDIVINLFGLEDWDLFLKKIKNTLVENGHFLTRLMLDSPLRKNVTLAEMITQFKQGKEIGNLDRTAVLFSDKDICSPKTHKIDMRVFDEKLKKFLDKGIISLEEYTTLKLPVSTIPVIAPAQDYFKKSLNGKFEVISSSTGKEFVFLKYFPIYLLRSLSS